MNFRFPLSILLILVFASPVFICKAQNQPTLFMDGKAWDPALGFVKKDLCVLRQKFVVLSKCFRSQKKVSLVDFFLVPPLADAQHYVAAVDKTRSDALLRSGVFYTMNANASSTDLPRFKSFFNSPTTYDMALMQGAITSDFKEIDNSLAGLAPTPYELNKSGSNQVYRIKDKFDIPKTAKQLSEQGSQLVKVFLYHSERHHSRKNRLNVETTYGVDPELMANVVETFHHHGIKVMAQVETDYDTRIAAEAGVDFISQLPGHSLSNDDSIQQSAKLSMKTIQAIQKNQVKVIPVYHLARTVARQSGKTIEKNPELQQHYQLQRNNLQMLQAYSIPILMGSGGYARVFDEAKHYYLIGAFSRQETLNTVFSTSRHLFPKRKVGCFDVGCDASFLVLAKDPGEGLETLNHIEYSMKQGQQIVAPSKVLRPRFRRK
ncbi:hypothetical protein FE810_11915 [Thalassotalea litorea]|uniref:Amidohydrolase-related domain-containing protein n=1 Tax=Thalassotalea litorea TaxID=2020715 RepID=A0A5R9IFL8_9GAMM|nr:hypothetical protein [Thalassotalea litorea]TLU64304.1 hypothetical protein FE810_11915 [Thalassotalea litorea]